MLKKIGIPLLTLAALLTVVPPQQAKAGVRFGVYLGAPAYVAPAPVYPPYPYPYVAPAPVYPAPAPAYVYPSPVWRGHDWDHRDWRGHDRHDDHFRGRR